MGAVGNQSSQPLGMDDWKWFGLFPQTMSEMKESSNIFTKSNQPSGVVKV